MQIIFESCTPDGAKMRDVVLRRVRFSMRNLSWLAPRVKVQMLDPGASCGGIDKRCRVELSTPDDGVVVVTSTTRDWLSALQSALARATKSLLHKLKPAHPQKRLALRLPVTPR